VSDVGRVRGSPLPNRIYFSLVLFARQYLPTVFKYGARVTKIARQMRPERGRIIKQQRRPTKKTKRITAVGVRAQHVRVFEKTTLLLLLSFAFCRRRKLLLARAAIETEPTVSPPPLPRIEYSPNFVKTLSRNPRPIYANARAWNINDENKRP